MIDILFIENSIGLSGSTLSLCTLLNYLDSDTFEAHIVLSRPEQETYLLAHLRRPGPITVIAPHRSLKQSAIVQRMLDRLGGRKPRLHRAVLQLASLLDVGAVTIPYAWSLYRWARERKIKLIHQNNGFDLGSLILSRMLRVPLVAYQRGDEWNSPAVRWLARGVRRFIANSATTRASLASLGISSRRISVIYPPLDFGAFRPERAPTLERSAFGVDPSGQCFGILGMLLPWKGHMVFLEAAKRVFETLPDARAFVIGAAPPHEKDYEKELHAFAHELGIAHRVIFAGFRPDVPDMLQLLDVVVHASISPEPFGRVIVEAMAMKRPVVATGPGGPTEIIDDGRTGFLIPPGDASAMADRVISLLKDPLYAERIADAAYSEVRRRFSAEVHSTLVRQVYEQAIKRSRIHPVASPLPSPLQVADKIRKGDEA